MKVSITIESHEDAIDAADLAKHLAETYFPPSADAMQFGEIEAAEQAKAAADRDPDPVPEPTTATTPVIESHVPPPVAAATQPPTVTPGLELDSDGVPWDERIHSGAKSKTDSGTWRKKKGVDKDEHGRITAELKAAVSAQPEVPTPTLPAEPQEQPTQAPAAVATPATPTMPPIATPAIPTPPAQQAAPAAPVMPPVNEAPAQTADHTPQANVTWDMICTAVRNKMLLDSSFGNEQLEAVARDVGANSFAECAASQGMWPQLYALINAPAA